jgi:hypothetical protein
MKFQVIDDYNGIVVLYNKDNPDKVVEMTITDYFRERPIVSTMFEQGTFDISFDEKTMSFRNIGVRDIYMMNRGPNNGRRSALLFTKINVY